MGRVLVRGQRRTEKEQREILQRFTASGMSCREFCRREGLAESSVQRWRARAGRASGARFVELVSPAAVPGEARDAWALELELPGNVRLRIRR